MRGSVTAVVVLIGTLVPATVFAQAASPTSETQLQQEMRHRRVIVRPLTPADQVQQDVDRATTEIQPQDRGQTVVRDLTRPAQRPAQADQDLKSGIQTRSLNDALRR
jgi:hypothetical protein